MTPAGSAINRPAKSAGGLDRLQPRIVKQQTGQAPSPPKKNVPWRSLDSYSVRSIINRRKLIGNKVPDALKRGPRNGDRRPALENCARRLLSYRRVLPTIGMIIILSPCAEAGECDNFAAFAMTEACYGKMAGSEKRSFHLLQRKGIGAGCYAVYALPKITHKSATKQKMSFCVTCVMRRSLRVYRMLLSVIESTWPWTGETSATIGSQVQTKGISLCSEMGSPDGRLTCLAETDPDRNSGLCEEISDPWVRGRCYGTVAVDLRNVALCGKISDSREADICFDTLAEQLNNHSVCEEMRIHGFSTGAMRAGPGQTKMRQGASEFGRSMCAMIASMS